MVCGLLVSLKDYFAVRYSCCVDVNLTRDLNNAVRYKDLLDDAYADMSNLLKSLGDVCAIVYCLERTTCDDLSAHLSSSGISSAGN